MYTKISPLQRIDELTVARQSQLYEPLRRSLLKNNLSQSNISSQSHLSNSRVNDFSSSRVSRRMRSLSPSEIQQIKSKTFIPINKRLVPTKNLSIVRDKKFEVIDVEEKIYQPISATRLNSINRFGANQVEEIVYETEDQLNQPHYQASYQSTSPLQHSFGPEFRQVLPETCFNIYTSRNQNMTNGVRGVSQVREYSPRESYQMALDARPMLDTFGGRNFTQKPFQQNISTYESHYVSSVPPNNVLNSVRSFQRTDNNVTSFENAPVFNPSILPIRNSTNIQRNSVQPSNLYTSQCNPQIRELPTENTLSFLASPLGSWTSFEPEIQKPLSSTSKSYDFSKLTQDSSMSEYKQKKQDEWKYNLFSFLDEPANTKCSKTGCFKNEIIASRPNLYEWQQ